MNSRNIKLREKSAKGYIDTLFDNYSKLCVVRVDLAYKKPYSDEVTLENSTKDINRLLNNRRSKPIVFKQNVGYILKKEYTENKGVHIHSLFFFDGNNVQKAIYKAKQIGEYWNSTITQKKGSHYNCHKNEYKYNGIGMIDYKDEDKIKILISDVVSYLCKKDQSIDIINDNKNNKFFIRGTIPKKKSNAGRPRNV